MTDSDTLRLLQDAATSFANFDAKRVRSWRKNDPCFDRQLWAEMAEQGWFGILADEDAGGMGLGLDAAAVVARALGRAAAPEPVLEQAFAYDGPVLIDFRVRETENCYPMVPAGGALDEMILGPQKPVAAGD